MRHIGDVVVQYQVSKMIKVGVNVVYGEKKLTQQLQPKHGVAQQVT
jgi:hypothetical protein